MNTPNPKTLLQYALLIICLAILAYYFYAHRTTLLSALSGFSWPLGLLIMLTVVLQTYAKTLCDRLVFASMNYPLPMGTLYELQAKQNILNYLPMKAGTLYAAGILRTEHKLAIAHYTAAFATQNILTLGMTLLATAIALTWLPAGANMGPAAATIALLSILVFSSLFLRFPAPDILPRRIRDTVNMLHWGADRITDNFYRLLLICVLRLLAVLLMTWRLQMLFEMGGEPISFAVAITLSASIILSLVISVTPGNLGVRELLMGATSGILTLPASLAVVVSIMDRALILAFSAVVILAASLFKRGT